MMPDAGKRYVALDGIRGIAAIIVMIYHFTSHSDKLTFESFKLLASSDVAVDLFFVLSGFVIYHTYSHQLQSGLSPQEYITKRFVRLYPMFLAGIILGAMSIFLMVLDGSAKLSIKEATKSLGFNVIGMPYANSFSIFDFGQPMPTSGEIYLINPPDWSLFFEAVGSFLFIFICKMQSSQLFKLIYLSFILFFALALLFGLSATRPSLVFGLGWETGNFVGGFPRVIFSFSSGIIIYRGLNNDFLEQFFRQNIWSNVIIVYFLTVIFLIFPTALRGLYPLLFITIFGPLLVWLGAKAQIKSELCRRMSIQLGWLSYPVYCLHYPIGRIVWSLGEKYQFAFGLKCIISIMCTIVVSYFLGIVFDEPMRRMLSDAFARSRQSSM